MSESFFTINIGNIVSAASTVVTIVVVFLKITKARKEEHDEQVEMHAENRIRLETLLKFQEAQEEINKTFRHQFREVSNQTTSIAEIARGFDRRLQMLEDRRRTQR